MKRSNRLILLIGFFLAAVAFVGVIMLLGSGNARRRERARRRRANTTNVVATADIPLGTTLTDDMVATEGRAGHRQAGRTPSP